ncbi:MAG: phosphate/phosphite/phosphonate ABC transporter substrate-binding protein [Proteobacteria bacterium]|nr:phosphate/phosphite/phosphonate ABC transporter substrate-binding protein [Pseudomonadota bacterium]MBU1738437.1 phosphate/phosphite/phosphonate ABC transporter substrate-binding protein [Pseudomonadota bacterium]
MTKTVPTPDPGQKTSSEVLRFAVGGMITPREGLVYYRAFLDYLADKIGRPVEYVDKESYAEINDLLREKKLDMAFVCSGPYVDGIEEFNLQPLAAPQAYGESVYYSYVIVPADSPVENFAGLKGRKFAFTDPQSNTGTLVPTYMLAKMNETPDSFFSSYEYTYAHDKSIKAVAMKLVDGAAVDSLIWEYANRKDPVHTSKTKVIHKSPPYGIPPVAVRSAMDPELLSRIREVFLNAHRDPEGREILAGMMIEKFGPVEDSRYDSVREMKTWLAKHKNPDQ